MSNVSNADIYGLLMDIREDIGSLKTASELQLKVVEAHTARIATLEGNAERQKGAVKVWGVVATAAATLVGTGVNLLRH